MGKVFENVMEVGNRVGRKGMVVIVGGGVGIITVVPSGVGLE